MKKNKATKETKEINRLQSDLDDVHYEMRRLKEAKEKTDLELEKYKGMLMKIEGQEPKLLEEIRWLRYTLRLLTTPTEKLEELRRLSERENEMDCVDPLRRRY